MKGALCVVGFFAASLALAAADPGLGTWALRSDSAAAGDTEQATLTVTPWSHGGRQLKYSIVLPGIGVSTLVIQTAMDGKDAPVVINGRVIGETMAIKRQDSRHATSVVKWNGTPTGTSTEAISEDGKTMTVITDMTTDSPTAREGKQTQVWEKQ
jgi:hypothetical protein